MRLLEVVEKAVLDARFDMPVTVLSSRHALTFSPFFFGNTVATGRRSRCCYLSQVNPRSLPLLHLGNFG